MIYTFIERSKWPNRHKKYYIKGEVRTKLLPSGIYPRTLEHNRHISQSLLGEKHPLWKGDQVGYKSLHEWVNNHIRKPELCDMCHKTPPKDCANKSHQYLRDLTDWWWLCRKCHMIYDEQDKRRDPKTGRFIKR